MQVLQHLHWLDGRAADEQCGHSCSIGSPATLNWIPPELIGTQRWCCCYV